MSKDPLIIYTYIVAAVFGATCAVVLVRLLTGGE